VPQMMKAAVVHDFKAPLSIEEVARPEAGPGQIVVKIETSGLCHTDIHAAHGDWPVKPTLPFIPGHEGVGRVEKLGPGVTHLKEGDRVAIPWLGYACGRCEYCISGWETLCEQQQNTGYSRNGAYAEYAQAYANYVARVPDGIDPFEAAPLTCAGVTTYKAVKMSGARPSDLVAIYGIGGLGHLALQYAKIAGASVVAVDLTDEKLALARQLGADYTVNGRNEDPVEAIQKLGGADAAISLAVSPRAFEQAYKSLRRGGTFVLVALPADNYMQLPIFETVLHGLRIIGSIVGTRLDLAEVFELHAAGRTKVIYEPRALNDVNTSFEAIERAAVPARLVLDMVGARPAARATSPAAAPAS
jgi:propanol-preferring alcohol dehydrogenase